jgi:hypothetical protein
MEVGIYASGGAVKDFCPIDDVIEDDGRYGEDGSNHVLRLGPGS